MAPHPELSSLATILGDVHIRLAAASADFRAGKRDDIAQELDEVERAVAAASRRLSAVADGVS